MSRFADSCSNFKPDGMFTVTAANVPSLYSTFPCQTCTYLSINSNLGHGYSFHLTILKTNLIPDTYIIITWKTVPSFQFSELQQIPEKPNCLWCVCGAAEQTEAFNLGAQRGASQNEPPQGVRRRRLRSSLPETHEIGSKQCMLATWRTMGQ